ncbi:hypothetical protein GGX14DRAFT_408888 [Mycena pura]|uniref:Uncharacterized protein n=1 Tax=Mycena pura TaxID=153505 RepID=A0AAD6UPD0_9AGAR|nr:hypothetical protein GGX14DRAFT_408888 [Mycena pura]
MPLWSDHDRRTEARIADNRRRESATMMTMQVLLPTVLLEIQDQLGEPLNPNGDMLKDLIDGSVRPVPAEGVDTLVAMLAQAGLRKRGAREKWTEEQFEQGCTGIQTGD